MMELKAVIMRMLGLGRLGRVGRPAADARLLMV